MTEKEKTDTCMCDNDHLFQGDCPKCIERYELNEKHKMELLKNIQYCLDNKVERGWPKPSDMLSISKNDE